MITNLIATILITVITNAYAPKQYWHENNFINCQAVYTLDSSQQQNFPANLSIPVISGFWSDDKPIIYQWYHGDSGPTERDNPDIRITEVRQIRTLVFEFEGKTYSIELSNVVMSTKKERRIVKTDERWEVEK
jgi:hypothetical protein